VLARVLPEVDPDRVERLSEHVCEQMSGRHDRHSFVPLDLPDVAPVRAWHDQQVPPRGGRLAEERDNRVVLVNEFLLRSPADDFAERAGGPRRHASTRS
jgi:hypothetical protein